MEIQFQLFFVLLVSQFIYAEITFEHSPRELAYHNAVNYCKGRYMNLVKIEDPDKNKIVSEYAKKQKLGKFWINGNDIFIESFWVNTEGVRLKYRNWYKTEPSGGRSENCIDVHKDELWYDTQCNNRRYALCETQGQVKENTGTFISSKKKLKYPEAVGFCLSHQKPLVKIEDAPTNLAVFNYAKSKKIKTYWINGNDIDEETIWVDSDRKRLPFRNWYHEDPDGGRKENCIVGGHKKSEVWTDVACTKKHHAIC